MRKYLLKVGRKARVVASGVGGAVVSGSAAFASTGSCAAGDTFCTITQNVNFQEMQTWITNTVGVAVIAIAMAFAAIKISKRGIKSV